MTAPKRYEVDPNGAGARRLKTVSLRLGCTFLALAVVAYFTYADKVAVLPGTLFILGFFALLYFRASKRGFFELSDQGIQIGPSGRSYLWREIRLVQAADVEDVEAEVFLTKLLMGSSKGQRCVRVDLSEGPIGLYPLEIDEFVADAQAHLSAGRPV